MSHASIIVALSPDDLAAVGGDVKKAVAHQMEPFDENGEWFKDGTRWDWWTIGGRYTGKFAVAGYRPDDDPSNFEMCFICHGTGIRNDALGRNQRLRDPLYKCNGCDGVGKSLKHASEWVEVGNVTRRGDLSEAALFETQKTRAIATWEKAESEHREIVRDFSFGIKPGETREEFIARRSQNPLTAYAFLKDRQWHEQDRLGWFASTTSTECERKAEAIGVEFTGRCIHTCEKSGAKIVSWTGEKDSEESWQRLYFARFIRPLPDDYTLVVVDYHV